MKTEAEPQFSLQGLLQTMQSVAVAVSGGVDSLSLATAAHRTPGVDCQMFHAVSPAVPPQATARVERLAQQEGWSLIIFDAGEFADPRYRDNPVDRCYYCKSGLYGSIAQQTGAQIISGANTDDLSDYRPGLQAASEHAVRHPYIEAGMGKDEVRALARQLGLDEIASLPASPCLASRVQTGLPINRQQLHKINQTELYVAEQLRPHTVRCRVKPREVEIQLDSATLDRLSRVQEHALRAHIGETFGFASHQVRFDAYAMGSAFLTGNPHETR